VQNQLLFLSLRNISNVSFQLLAQLKLLTAALFSVILLKRRLDLIQWTSLVVLVTGVVIAHMPNEMCGMPLWEAFQRQPESTSFATDVSSTVIGVASVLCSCCLSGFSGAFMERAIKRDTPPDMSVHYLSVQLCLYSVVTNGISILIRDNDIVQSGQPFVGFTWLTWVIILSNSCGGILVSLVMRYTSNVAKGFAVSAAVFGTGIVSSMILDYTLTVLFSVGMVLSVCASIIYNERVRASRNGPIATATVTATAASSDGVHMPQHQTSHRQSLSSNVAVEMAHIDSNNNNDESMQTPEPSPINDAVGHRRKHHLRSRQTSST
jgi:solute carrier family 35 (UDP-sugar transporter), member A1/2/3